MGDIRCGSSQDEPATAPLLFNDFFLRARRAIKSERQAQKISQAPWLQVSVRAVMLKSGGLYGANTQEENGLEEKFECCKILTFC